MERWTPPRPHALVVPALLLALSIDTSAAEPPQADAGLAAALARAAAEQHHDAVWQVGTPLEGVDAAWQASNREEELRAFFLEKGVALQPRAEAPAAWRASLRLAELRRGASSERVAPGSVSADGARVTISRPGLVEWYQNDERGFEQGFDLAERYAADQPGPLELVVAVDGLALGEVGASAASLVDASAATLLRLSGLFAFDAAGRALPCRFERRGDELAYVVEDAGAAYPLVVDPLITHERARLDLEGVAAPDAEFGRVLARSGDYAVVGAPNHEVVYVLRNPNSDLWRIEAKLANAGDPGNGFGAAVAVNSRFVAVGAPHQTTEGVADAGRVYIYGIDEEHAEVDLETSVREWPPESGAGFGAALQLTTYDLYVGAPRSDASGADSGEVYRFGEDDGYWWVRQKLAPVGTFPGARFGQSLDFGGLLAAVGAPTQFTGFTSSGAVWVWRWDDQTDDWQHDQTLSLTTVHGFGTAVSCDLRLIAVGTPGDDRAGTDRGSVRIYQDDDATQTMVFRDEVFGASQGDELGAALDLDASIGGGLSRLAAGAPGAEGQSGAVHVLDSLGGASWFLNTLYDGFGEPGARFGSSVALSYDAVVTGGPFAANGGWTSGAALVLSLAEPGSEPLRWVPLDQDTHDGFGYVVAVDGDLAVVGAAGDDDGGGGAYVFRRGAGGWSLEAKLDGDEHGHVGDSFGAGVDVEDGRIVVGAPRTIDDGGVVCGSVHVFEHSAQDGWVRAAALFPPSPLELQSFGARVCLSGDRVAIFSYRAAGVGLDEPSVQLWADTGAAWILEDELELTAAEGIVLAHSIALEGDRLAVGAPTSGTGGRGLVRFYERSGAAWLPIGDVEAPGSDPEPYFGWSLDLEAERLLVGAIVDAEDRGAAHLFEREVSSGAWLLDTTFLADDGAAYDRFGSGVALEGETVVVGAYTAGAGKAYAYQRTGTTWTSRHLVPSAPTAAMNLGYAVDLSGGVALVGAGTYGEDESGACFVFELGAPSPFHAFAQGDGTYGPCPCGNESAPWSGEGCRNSTGVGALLGGSGSASITTDDMRIELAQARPSQPVVLFTADVLIPPVPYGDGLVSMTGWVERLQPKVADADGAASWQGLLTGENWAPGSVRLFQAWYRDPGASPCGASFNLSNGVYVILEP